MMNIEVLNQELRNAKPEEIISWALAKAEKPVVTTNFRPYEVALLHALSCQSSDIPVIWCDTGYNTPQTYKHANELISCFKLNVDLFVPQQTAAFRDVILGIPEIDTPEHDLFTEQVKLEPFQRAMAKHQPDVWFTNLRKEQTDFRANLDILSISNTGVLKVSPFFHWTEAELDEYLAEFNLPNETKYYDPTKVLANRECGLHKTL